MAAITSPAEHRLVLEGISWTTFEALLEDLGPHRARRLTYDEGELEIMSPFLPHESLKTLIARMIEVLALELDRPVLGAGALTIKRADLKKAVEPDECYYVQNEPRVRGRTDAIDFAHDPPPDLVVEVDITASSTRRLRVYAALGVPEVWQWRDDALRLLRLQADGRYTEADESAAFPGLRTTDLQSFLDLDEAGDQHQTVKRFRDWARSRAWPK